MYLHKTKNENYTPPCCYFSGELEVVEILRFGFCCKRQLRMGLVGESKYLCKLLKESTYVNGLSIEAIYSDSLDDVPAELKKLKTVTDNLDVFINAVDAVYIRSFPTKHYEQIKKVLNAGKHVLCESPITLDKEKIGIPL